MLIRVLCSDKSRGYVEDCNLQDLIGRGVVVAYFRPETNEWINAGENTSDEGKKRFRKNSGISIKS
jgi:hypothetical protein